MFFLCVSLLQMWWCFLGCQEDVALTDFFHPLFSKCACVCASVRKCGHVYVLSVQVSKCTFTLSYTHTCILPKLTQSVCRTPNHDYKLKCEELFVCFFLLFLVLLCFIHVHFISFFFFLGFSQDDGTPENFYVLPQIGTSHTAKRYSCGEGAET